MVRIQGTSEAATRKNETRRNTSCMEQAEVGRVSCKGGSSMDETSVQDRHANAQETAFVMVHKKLRPP